MIKIKICGLRRKEDILIVNKYKPDYIGFVFAEKSKRKINIDEALYLKSLLDKDIKAVGVFLNNDLSFIKEIVNKNIIDVIQLHGNEENNYLKKIKEFTSLPIIKAYNDDPLCDFILIDNIIPGSGIEADYKLPNVNKPCFIAGGINKDNVLKALKQNPYCIDVSSGVEINGFKDEEKIKEIIKVVRDYEG